MLSIEWIGAILGITGSLMISMNRPWSKFAWPKWIVSNLLLMTFAATIGAWGIFSMQAVFLAINANGVWQWLLRPPQVAANRSQRNYWKREGALRELFRPAPLGGPTALSEL